MYSRDEIKTLTDKVLNMAKADAVEVNFDGGERSATRWANSIITANMVQYDQQLTLTVRIGAKQGSASTRGVRRRVVEGDGRRGAGRGAEGARQCQPARLWSRDRRSTSPWMRRCRRPSISAPAERAAWSSNRSISARRRVCSAPATSRRPIRRPACANSEGLFAYYQAAEAGFVLTCRMARRQRLGLGRDHRRQGPLAGRRRGADRDRREQGAQEPETARHRTGPLHDDPRAARQSPASSRLMTGAFNAGGGGGGFGGGGGGSTSAASAVRSSRPTACRRSARSCSATASR